MSFYTSLSGLKGAQTDLGTVSNNIANVGTVGFKKSRAQFGDIVAASATTAGRARASRRSSSNSARAASKARRRNSTWRSPATASSSRATA
jgi:flagellar hook protein FlgE